VPAVHGIVEVEGQYGIVFDRIDGPLMMEELITKPGEQKHLIELFAELHAKMHTIRVTGLPSQREKLESQIHSAKRLSKKGREAALSSLTKLPEDNILCHGDYHPGNILMSSRGPVVIDWVDATEGNPHADVARSLLLIHVAEPDLIQDVVQRQATPNLIQRLPLEVYFKRYRQFHSLSQEQLDAWKLPVAAARLSEGLSRIEENRLLSIVDSFID
jgi:aminoglycoside phosphotransferase (APT) family kinase protein